MPPEIQHDRLEAVSRIDLSKITQRLSEKCRDWTPERVQIAVEEYRRFLYLAMTHPDVSLIPPTPDIDEVWHNHILYTVQYADDCETLFGEFFHHQPGEGEMPMNLYQETLELYRTVFRTEPSGQLWTG